MRAARTLQLIDDLSDFECVWWFDQLLRGALWGHTHEADALLALSMALIRIQLEDRYEQIQSLFAAAHEEQRKAVLYLLRDAPPHRALPEGSRLPEVRLPLERDVSLGERRSFASGSNKNILDRLVDDPNELVIKKLLDNAYIQTSHVLSIASKRPTRPILLNCVAQHHKWLRYIDLREALVRNPFISTGVALKLLPTLGLPLLHQLKHASDIHPAISEFAKILVTLREERTAPLRV